jgi:cyclopropane-fatty-acyl-phospholipid synthase
MNEIVVDAPRHEAGFSALDRLLRQRLLAQLDGLVGRRLEITDALGTVVLGVADNGASPLRIHVAHPDFYRAVAANGSVGAGEAYIDGLWRCDDLVGLVRALVVNRDKLDDLESGFARCAGWALRSWNALRRNTRAGSRRNIATHYDLGNEFFGLFLSSDLMYSSALFAGDTDTLESASRRKLEHTCRKLNLRPGDRVIEIGGAGAASRCMLRSTTVAMSLRPRFRMNSTRSPRSASRRPACRIASRCCSRTTATCQAATTSWFRSR